jgi:signal peptidase I
MNRGKAFAAPQSVRFLVPALLVMVCLFLLQGRYRLVLVVGESMQPTLEHGDLLVVSKRSYDQREPIRGDVVVAWSNGELLVKRVVGLPGEVLEIVNGGLYVNHELVLEDHAVQGSSLDIGRGSLANGRFALLGDNRGLSSRVTVSAIVSRHDMLGKVVYRLPIGG